MNLETFWVEYMGFVLLGAVLLLMGIFQWANRAKRIKKVKKKEPTVNFNETLFGSSPTSVLETLEQQKKNAEVQLHSIGEQGKEIVLQEQEMDIYYYKDKEEIKARKNELGLKYTTWKKQLEGYSQMIANQKRMDEELR